MPKKLQPQTDQTEGSFDKFDLAILKLLLSDSRRTLNDLSAEIGLSPTTCWNRVKRLEAEGVIKRYTIDLDNAKLGYRDSVIVHLTLESHSDRTLDEFGKQLAAMPEVIEAYLVSGEYDYYIRFAVRDTRDYERLLRERLYKIPGIRHSKSHFVLRVLKDRSEPIA
jgi:Lrp/AsnC family transcriptional regulator, leucine-responsive regulatory protein